MERFYFFTSETYQFGELIRVEICYRDKLDIEQNLFGFTPIQMAEYWTRVGFMSNKYQLNYRYTYMPNYQYKNVLTQLIQLLDSNHYFKYYIKDVINAFCHDGYEKAIQVAYELKDRHTIEFNKCSEIFKQLPS